MAEKHKQDANGLYLDSVGGRAATAEDLILYDQGVNLLATMQAPRFLSANDPHERVYYVCFDGTGNDVDKDPQHATNVATLKKQLEEIRDNSDNRVAVGYISGPGTQKNPATRTWDGARGYTYEQRIVQEYTDLQKQVERWQQEDPDVKVRVVVVGFSRGAEQAAGFTRLLDEVGILDPDDNKIRYKNNHWVGNPTHPPLVAPGQTPQAVALFDPVGTGKPLQFDRRLPPSVVSGIQLISRDEARDQFKSTQIIEPGLSADGRFAGIIVPGAHSDVGGSYHRDGLSLRSGNLIINYLNGLTEVPQLKLQTERSNPDMYMIHSSEDHLAVYSTRHFNKHQERGMRHEAPAAICRPVEVCVPEPAAPSLMAALPRYTVQVQTPPREPPMEPARPIALSPDVVVHDPLTQASPQPPPAPIPAEIDNATQQRQQQQLQREEQRHTAGIQAATEQQATARTALDNGLLLTDPDHPAHEHYENARQGVVRVYSHQRMELDDRVEPMAASLVAQAQREGLSNINAVTLSADGQHLVASNTRDATAEHREMVQVPAAQAAHQSVADSSRQWAEQRIAQAQAQIQVHTQARTQVQERAQTYTPTLERAPARTPPHEPDRQAEAQMQQSQHQSQQAVQQVLLQQNAAREREEERLEKSRQDAQPGALPGRATDDVSTAPEHRRDHRMAPSAGQFPSQPERAPIAQADAHPEMHAGVEQKPLPHAPAQAEDRAAYVTPIQRGRSTDEDAKEQQPEPRREAGHRRDPGESAPSMNHAAAVALASGKDPRHPNHPDHALHQQIQDKTEALCESKGIPLAGDQLDRVAASLTAEAKRVKISSADHVLFSERPGTQEIGENLIVVQGALDNPAMRFCYMAAHEAAQTPIAASFDKLEQVNQTQAMQQQQQLAQEQQQEQSRSAHRMVM